MFENRIFFILECLYFHPKTVYTYFIDPSVEVVHEMMV